MSKLICTIEGRNMIDIYEDHAEIIIDDKRYNEPVRVMIDLEDVDKCKDYKWRISRNGSGDEYVRNDIGIFLHRFLLDVYGSSKRVRILDNNAFNCKKTNLNYRGHDNNATPINIEPEEEIVPEPISVPNYATDNNHKTIVHADTGYHVFLELNGETLFLGMYDSEEDAEIAYISKVDDIYKELYRTTDPLGLYQ